MGQKLEILNISCYMSLSRFLGSIKAWYNPSSSRRRCQFYTRYQQTSEVKWIAFGGSYGGTLAAWLRQRYLYMVTGAMSSSDPLEAILDFNDAYFGLGKSDLLEPPDSVDLRTVSSKWFEQKLDHFSPTDTRTWQQRYHLNDAYFNESTKNHIFLMVEGESAADPKWVNYGAWIETVKQYGGLLLHLEHRFYGESMPLSNLSTENLKYLSTHQALEDIANFIQGINKEYNLTSEVKWIAFGGSYGGTLVAWLRQKYPHLVTGAVSSSGPLEAILDFNEYLEVVEKVLASHSQACVDSIKLAYTQLDELVTSCLEDIVIYSDLNEAFILCDGLETIEGNDKDLSNLFEVITNGNFPYVVQYQGIAGMNVTIEDMCNIMLNETSDVAEVYRLGEVSKLIKSKQGLPCTEYKYDNLVGTLQNTTANKNSILRQWYYQTCTQFGFFKTSSQENPIFGSRFNISFLTGLCQDIFGPEFNETMISSGIEATNNRYGGKDIDASNIVYYHSTVDPWHVLGKQESTDGQTVILLEDASHCANMYAPQETDPTSLKEARKEINTLIGQWLGVVSKNNGNSSTIMTSSMAVFITIFVCLYQFI